MIDKKIKISHDEVSVKLFLEVLGVYFVLMVALVGIYYAEPVITGFVTVEKQLNYTDDVELEFNSSQTYVWTLGNGGKLKSVKIDGSMGDGGEARVFIENNGTRLLIFDSTQLVEKESGLFGITGFAANYNMDEDKKQDEIKTETEGILNDDQKWIFDLLVLDINETKNNVMIEIEAVDGNVSNEVIGTTSTAQDQLIENLSVSLENSTDIKIKIESEFEAGDGIETPVNETPIINETTINDTIEKIIEIELGYGNNEFYDADNNGIEVFDSIIDFEVDGSFNWDVDESNLCTRYEVYSVDNQASEFACFGNNDCCGFIGLESSRELWDEGLFLSLGGYGSTNDNIVFAQVLYVDYNLSPENPYTNVSYSSWDNKTAEFVEDFIEFQDVCIDSCIFDGNLESYNLIIEIDGTHLKIDKIDYTIEEKVANNIPELTKKISNVTITKNKEYLLDLGPYFSDADEDELIYSSGYVENLIVTFEGGVMRIVPEKNFTGTRFVAITANDSIDGISSNMFKVDVVETGLELLGIEKGENITISFLAYGSSNLTIKASGSYAEFFNDNVTSADDLEIVELKCGNFEIFDKNELIETDDLWFILQNGSRSKMAELLQENALLESMFVEDYFCEEVSYLTAKDAGGGNLAQKIEFGNNSFIADVFDVVVDNTFEIRGANDSKLAVFDSFGNLKIKGNLTENITGSNDGNDFVIMDAEGEANLLVANPEGNVFAKGFLNENQSSLAAEINSFIIENNIGDTVTYISSNGDLYLKGSLSQNVLFG